MKRDKHVSAKTATHAAPPAPESGRGIVMREPANDLGSHRSLRVDGWQFVVWQDAGDDQPRIQDVDLGARLGYPNPKDMRRLGRDHEVAKNINPFHVKAALARTGAAPRTEDELWFTEEDALFLVTKSSMPASVALTKEMIRVFMLARRGLLPQQAQPAPTLSAEAVAALAAIVAQGLAVALAPIVARLAGMEARIGGTLTTSGMVSPAVAASIKYRLREAAKVVVACGQAKKGQRGARLVLEQRLRGAVKWAGTGCTIANMPVSLEAEALRELEMIERETTAVANALNVKRQMDMRPLFDSVLGTDAKNDEKKKPN